MANYDRRQVGPAGAGAGALLDGLGVYVPGVVNGKAWGANTLTKLQTGALTKFAVIHDLTGMAWASSLRTKTYPGLLATALQARWGDGGSGFYPASNSPVCLGATGRTISPTALAAYRLIDGDLYSTAGTANSGAGSWVPGGGTDTNGRGAALGLGVPGWECPASTAAGDTITGKTRGRYCDIFTTGAAGYAITADSTARTPASGLTAALGVGVWTIDFGAGNTGWHTVTLTTTGTAIKVPGFSGRNDSGAQVNRFGVYRMRIADFDAQTASLSSGANSGILQSDMVDYGLYVNSVANRDDVNYSMTALAATIDAHQVARYAGGAPLGAPNSSLDWGFSIPFIGFEEGPQRSAIFNLARLDRAAVVDVGAHYRQSYTAAAADGFYGNAASLGAAGTDSLTLSDHGHAVTAYEVSRKYVAASILPAPIAITP